MKATEIQKQALQRAQNGCSEENDLSVIQQFAERGISPADIIPRENVLTFNAWKAKGRVVKKGEKAAKIVTYIPIKDKETDEVTGVRPKNAFVFHISQTKALD